MTWSQNGVQQSRNVHQPIGIATSHVAQLRQLFFIYGFDSQIIRQLNPVLSMDAPM